jgi:hypothetical protein
MPKLLTTAERQEISRALERAESAPTEMEDEVLLLAQQFSEIHGRVRATTEENGLHKH